MGFPFIAFIMCFSTSWILGQIQSTSENPYIQVDEDEVKDFIIGTEHEIIFRTAIAGEHYRWPGGLLPYKISKHYGE